MATLSQPSIPPLSFTNSTSGTLVSGSESPSTSTIVKSMVTGAHVLLQALVSESVDSVFGLPGGVILSIYQALPLYPELKHILVRHEQGAIHMAEGYARSTGKPGVVLVTSGPGATNIITGLTDAYYDSVPLVVFTGNVPTHLLGNDAFQEADITGMTRPCTKHNLIVRDANDLAQAIKEAFYVAQSGRPGPVLVDLPKDILNAALPSLDFKAYQEIDIDLPGYCPKSHENFDPNSALDDSVKQLLALLSSAERPVLLCGGGVIAGDASEAVTRFAKRFDLPVTCSLMGLGGFPANDPLFLGFSGMHGQVAANLAIAQADLLIVAGNRLNERQTGNASRFAPNATIVHIDLDPTSLQKNVHTSLPIQGALKPVFEHLLKFSQDPSTVVYPNRTTWFETLNQLKQRNRSKYANHLNENQLTPQTVIERLFHWMPEDGFVTTEVGQHQMWAAQRFNLARPRSFISSGGLGTMGFGFPAALGIQVAFPDKTVLDIAGDGSFQMTLQELATARDYGLPVKIAIINNGHLGMIRQWQTAMYQAESEARLTSPNYVLLAEAYGCVGFRVTDVQDIDKVIQAAMAIRDRPVIIDFQVQQREDVYPWVPVGASNDAMLIEQP